MQNIEKSANLRYIIQVNKIFLHIALLRINFILVLTEIRR